MIRYVAAAVALKAFSSSPAMRQLYRSLGNVVGGRRRLRNGLHRNHLHRARDFLRTVRQFDAIHDGDTLLELGTGWVHWESTFIRLFYDTRALLFDVWDNRQLSAFRKYFSDLDNIIDKEMEIRPDEHERVHALLRAVSSVTSFTELYELIGSKHVINPRGTLDCFPDKSFNAIFSCSVLEHVKKDALSQYIRDFYRVLKPGGYSIHTIDIGDHLSYYDAHIPPKYYLRYSDSAWKHWFENEIQYINRVQRSEWLDLFAQAGLEVVGIEEIPVREAVSANWVASQFRNLDSRDLQCKTLNVVHRKPD